MNLATLLTKAARTAPDRPAIIDGRAGRERITSFGELEERIQKTAARFRAIGMREGTRVLVLVPMGLELYLTLATLWHLGAVAVFLDPSAGRKAVRRCCGRARPEALVGIARARFLVGWHAPLRRVGIRWYWPCSDVSGRDSSPALDLVDLPNDHPAILTFTSGSTGEPKGAIRSHGLLHAQYQALHDSLALQAGEVDLSTMSVFTLINLAAGITSLIPDARLSTPGRSCQKRVLRQIARFRPHRTVASPAFLHRLVEADEGGEGFPSFQHVFTGGAPVFPRTFASFADRFRNARVSVLYGSTEAEPISHVAFDEVTVADRTVMREGGGLLVGPVAPPTELLILPDQTGTPLRFESKAALIAAALPANRVGEIIVAGPHVIPGYLEGIGDAENKISVGGRVWHRTGDAGMLDERSRLWLLGRCTARIDLPQGTVYPFAVETAAVEQFGCTIAACLAVAGRPVLCLPRGTACPQPLHIPRVPVAINDIRLLRLPLDKRHNAKIDYSRLFLQLRGK